MLNLSVSAQPCIPGRAPADLGARKVRCEACGAPGGADGSLLEKHLIGGGKFKHLCPICHACLHLDVAGRMKAGKIIWMPELSQEQLNLMCLSMFVALSRGGVYRKNEGTKGIVESATRLYGMFERRAESIELLLGGSAVKSVMPRASLSSPTHIASLIVSTKRETKLSAKELAGRADGMRLLPAPKAFAPYIDRVSRIVTQDYPVPTWTQRVSAAHAERKAAEEREQAGAVQFDAEPNAAAA